MGEILAACWVTKDGKIYWCGKWIPLIRTYVKKRLDNMGLDVSFADDIKNWIDPPGELL